METGTLSVPLVVVAVVTRGDRPDLLSKLLLSLERQVDAGRTFRLAVVLVCNGHDSKVPTDDSDGLEVLYGVETEVGIPIARNTSLELAMSLSPQFIAFIDDDEVASPEWIAKALSAIESYSADAVAGRVEYEFENHLPHWLRYGGFYDAPAYTSGAVLPFARTTNLLVRAEAFSAFEPRPFSEILRYTGGSDIELTQRMTARGVRIVWSTDAYTVEFVPAERCTPSWALRRAYRVGNTAGRTMRSSGRPLASLRTVASGIARLPYALMQLVWGLLRADGIRFGNGARIFMRGLGITTSPLHRYEEYRR